MQKIFHFLSMLSGRLIVAQGCPPASLNEENKTSTHLFVSFSAVPTRMITYRNLSLRTFCKVCIYQGVATQASLHRGFYSSPALKLIARAFAHDRQTSPHTVAVNISPLKVRHHGCTIISIIHTFLRFYISINHINHMSL